MKFSEQSAQELRPEVKEADYLISGNLHEVEALGVVKTAYIVTVRFNLPDVPSPTPVGFKFTRDVTFITVSQNDVIEPKLLLEAATDIITQQYPNIKIVGAPNVVNISSVDFKVFKDVGLPIVERK